MGSSLVKYQDNKRAGLVGSSYLSPQAEKILQARKINTSFIGNDYLPGATDIDYTWGYSYNSSKAPHTYFDYFFTGQDISIYIDGLTPDRNAAGDNTYGALPIMDFQFGVQQQKQPVYGFWSYTHDTVMRGTRIVNGMFRLATTRVDYMTDCLAQAANARVYNSDYVIAGLDVDEQNIEQYWYNHPTDVRGPSIFSSHPPFNFVIVYGIQTPTIYNPASGSYDEIYSSYKDDTALMTDTNERMVEAGSAQKYILLNCEITGMQVEYSSDGQPCAESYTFFAMDCQIPPPDSLQMRIPSTTSGGG